MSQARDIDMEISGTQGSPADLGPDGRLIFAAWLLATTATLGSLFFSHVMEFAPCILCWYQRICLFPLVLILARGLFPVDRRVARYALPLAAAGWLLAFYHQMLYAGIVPASMQPCSRGVSCTEEYIELFGILSIPMMALLAFTALVGILIVLTRRDRS